MKKLFLGRSKVSLTVRITALFISGLAAFICLGGTSLLFAQSAVSPTNPFCHNIGSSVPGTVNTKATCNGQANLLGRIKHQPSKNPTFTGQLPTQQKNPNSGSNPSFVPNSSSHPSSGSTSNPTDTPNTIPNRSSTPSSTSHSTSNPPTNGQGQNIPQTGQGQTSGSGTVTQAAQAVLNQINAARTQAGLPALQMSTQLINSAHTHNLAMQSANTLSHQLPNEPAFGTRINQAGVNWSSAGENIGESSDYQNPTNAATGLDQSMLNEQPPNDGHRQNILSKDFTMVGIDVIVDTTHNKIWLTEDFAKA